MGWFGTVVGGTFGFLLGGPLGAILGASVGHQFAKGLAGLESLEESLNPGDQQRVQIAFFTATFSVMGHIAKADGHVSPEEISQANRVMNDMALTSEMRTAAINLFQQGKQAGFPLDEVLAQFYKECHRRTDLLRMFLEIQLQEAFADGILAASEEKLLLHICAQLKISRFDYERSKIRLQAQHRFQGYGSYTPRTPQKTSLQDAYGVLGLTPSAGKAEVKNAYRRLMSQNHPDKLVAKGLPEEMMRLAKEKTQKISKAYDTIQKAG
jgi:DnaJ like chaperone protein